MPDKVRQQAEERARIEAERLLNAKGSEQPAAERQVAPEPSLEQRLADIDRRSRERAADEKRQLAAGYMSEAQAKFKRLLSNTSDEALKAAYEQLQKFQRLAGSDAEAGGGAGLLGEGRPASAGHRERRSGEALRADAEKLVAYIKDNPGSKGSAVSQATGVHVKPPLNVRSFVEKYMPGSGLRTEGQKAGTVYFVG